MSSEKKCPHCGNWSKWNESLGAKCTECGKLLSEQELEQRKLRTERTKQQEKEWMFHYEQDAPFYVKIYKQIGSAIYMVFMAIVSFLVWLFLWLGP